MRFPMEADQLAFDASAIRAGDWELHAGSRTDTGEIGVFVVSRTLPPDDEGGSGGEIRRGAILVEIRMPFFRQVRKCGEQLVSAALSRTGFSDAMAGAIRASAPPSIIDGGIKHMRRIDRTLPPRPIA